MRQAFWIACLASLLGTGPALAEAPVGRPPTIMVQGEASEAFLPDKAILSLGVVTERPRAVDASTENSKAVQAVIGALKEAGIEPRQIQSTSVSLEPLFKSNDNDVQTITGFQASNQLAVEVSPPDRAGILAGTLIDKGVNTIDGIRFASNANDERADRLRGLAMRDARHKAEVYVGALGLKLGRVVEILPGSPRLMSMSVPSPRREAASPVAVPLQAGEQTDTSSVSVIWEIVQ